MCVALLMVQATAYAQSSVRQVQTTVPYSVRPGMTEWSKLKTHDEMLSNLQQIS